MPTISLFNKNGLRYHTSHLPASIPILFWNAGCRYFQRFPCFSWNLVSISIFLKFMMLTDGGDNSKLPTTYLSSLIATYFSRINFEKSETSLLFLYVPLYREEPSCLISVYDKKLLQMLFFLSC